MFKPIIEFEPHVPTVDQVYGEVRRASETFQKVWPFVNDYLDKVYYPVTYVAPYVLLSDKVIDSVELFPSREREEYDPYEVPEGGDIYEIRLIKLFDYVRDTHTIILYYNAIVKFANSNNLDYSEAYEYAIAEALFRAVHEEVFPAAFIWQDHKNPIMDKCNLLSDVLYEFFAFMYCESEGYYNLTNYLISTWEKNFYSTWHYAQALYFMYSKRRPLDKKGFTKKHYDVFYATNSSYKKNGLEDSLDILYFR